MPGPPQFLNNILYELQPFDLLLLINYMEQNFSRETQLVKKTPALKTVCLPCSQKRATGFWHEPTLSSSQPS
jgi:hypothetical protein